jgi:hypothetical protein
VLEGETVLSEQMLEGLVGGPLEGGVGIGVVDLYQNN